MLLWGSKNKHYVSAVEFSSTRLQMLRITVATDSQESLLNDTKKRGLLIAQDNSAKSLIIEQMLSGEAARLVLEMFL